MSARVVVGLAGAPGAGKSALAAELARRLGARVVQYDQFQPITRLPPEEVRAWFLRGGDPNEFEMKGLLLELARWTRPASEGSRHVVFETPFGRLHRRSGAYIDFLVWLDTPPDVALSRAMLAALEMFARASRPEQASGFLAWQRQYLLNYPSVREMYAAQRAAVAGDAELTLDGLTTTAEMADRVILALTAWAPQTPAAPPA
jgi:shikimate kinase